jgi:hypothetical protein
MTTLGEQFARALAAKDFVRMTELLHPEVDFRGMTGRMVDRDRVAWRFAVTTPDGPHLVEQQAYYSTTDGRISWMRVLCSGFRPATPE